MPVDLGAIFQQLGVQQPSGNPSNGQASYANGWQGFTAGLGDYQNRVNSEQKGRVEQTRTQLMQMIDSIPDSEQNASMKLKMKLDIMNAKDKHWSDKVLAPHAADDMISKMYKIFNDKLPQSQQQPQMAQPDENGQQGGMSFGVGPSGPGGGQGVQISPPADNTGKFAFEDKGKWRDVNEVFQDEQTGNKYLMQIDAATGKTKKIDLGKAKTVKEINAEVAAKARSQARGEAVSRGYYTRAVALSRLTPAEFNALDVDEQRPFYESASKQLEQEQALINSGRVATTDKNNAVAAAERAAIPLKQAQTANVLAQPRDPNAVTADDARTMTAQTATIEAEIKRQQVVADNKDLHYTQKEQKDAKAKLETLKRQRDAIRSKYLPPVPQTTKPRAGATPVPRGTSGPVGKTNDPLGIRP